jgi:hypothetical protein
MAGEAESVLGPHAASELRRQADEAERQLTARSTPGFRAFTALLS